jgi:5-methylcytosine-specific restriction endonuclease McrA
MKKKPNVLVLNKNFVPIHIISWQKAMSLLIQEAARAIDDDYIVYGLEDWFIYSELDERFPKVLTVKHKISLPEIIVLRKYDRLPIRDVKYSRQTLFERDNFKCAYCGERFNKKDLTVDHITPRSLGGSTTWTNTISACYACNSKKANKTIEESGMKLLFQPKKPRWISPLTDIDKNHPCKSWTRFLDKTLVDLG